MGKKAPTSPLQNHLSKAYGGTGFKGKQVPGGWSKLRSCTQSVLYSLLKSALESWVRNANLVSFAGWWSGEIMHSNRGLLNSVDKVLALTFELVSFWSTVSTKAPGNV